MFAPKYVKKTTFISSPKRKKLEPTVIGKKPGELMKMV